MDLIFFYVICFNFLKLDELSQNVYFEKTKKGHLKATCRQQLQESDKSCNNCGKVLFYFLFFHAFEIQGNNI